MIGFFRKTRKKLADNNKPLIYARYAVGEILLVVIGILIALQVNNWNEAKKTATRERNYLERIKEDLVQDTIYFNRRLADSKNVIDNHYELIHRMYEEQKNKNEITELLSLLNWNSEHLTIQNSTYVELLSTGQINIFSNIELKKDILFLYKRYDEISTHVKEINEFSTQLYAKIVNNHSKYRPPLPTNMWDANMLYKETMFDKIEWQYINQPFSEDFRMLETTAYYYMVKHTFFTDYFIELREDTSSIIRLIDKELNTR